MNFKEWWNWFKEENKELESYEYYRLDTSEELVRKGWNAALEEVKELCEIYDDDEAYGAGPGKDLWKRYIEPKVVK